MTVCQRNARVQLLIEQIRKHPETFDYEFVFGKIVKTEFQTYSVEARDFDISATEFVKDCNTTCCFAGWTIALFAPEEVLSDLYTYTRREYCNIPTWCQKAAGLLGLTDTQGESLFLNSRKSCRNSEEAISFLRNFISKVNERQQEEEASESSAAV